MTKKQHIVFKFNRATIAWRSIVLAVALQWREVPLRARRLGRSARAWATPKRLALAGLACAVFAVPVTLYVAERSTRLAEARALRAELLAASSEAGYLSARLDDLDDENRRMVGLLLASGHSLKTRQGLTVKVVATGYSSSVIETDDTPFVTAANTRTREGVIAVSRDLLTRYTPGAPFSFGDRVRVPGLGYFIVEDSMHGRWDNRVDIWFPSREKAREFGVREVYLTLVEPVPQSSPPAEDGALAATGL